MTTSALSTDLYELNMVQAYLDRGENKTAVFEFFVRKLPARRSFLMAAGLESVLDYLETLSFTAQEIDWLKRGGRFRHNLLEYLENFRFTGDVHAMPEGTVFFPHEPILRITAPLPQAQLIETRLISILQFQSMIASKAARMVLAAGSKSLADFGLRSAHGSEAGLWAARASYIAGFSGAANVAAGRAYGIPIVGTMAHSFVQVYGDELAAFEQFARARPDNVILLIDTYDTEAGARHVVELAPKLKADGIAVRGVRIDSGDLVASSKKVRAILDAGGLNDAVILVSGGINEDEIVRLAKAGAPIDGYGIGANLTTSQDAPTLDCAYKLQEYDGKPKRKLSEGKQTWPGRKQVWRNFADGIMTDDIVSIESDTPSGEALIVQVMKSGKRIDAAPTLDAIREAARRNLMSLPPRQRELDPEARYTVVIGDALQDLARDASVSGTN
ncbi:MAG: nicotinate phosphoribosyltransferase [Pseudolabrys sp.]|nr:nicotinate phosphoribosyltransferase [Pseudolabrys sp.]